jgi:tetratricopeptide (TPR) repeat protein
MANTASCFVIIGFGKKTSYINGKVRVLDLDETYTLLIKPVFEDLKIPCYRAIDKNLSGSIDQLMLQEIKTADFVVADISTLNANVMWELGVRHALQPHYTILMCEKEQMASIPFDINHFVVHQYTHSEEGIPFKEVDRFRTHLKGIINGLINQHPKLVDSPVFTFLEKEKKDTQRDIQLAGGVNVNEKFDPYAGESFATIMQKAEAAKNAKDFDKALELFGIAEKHAKNNMTLRDNISFIVSRQALCTYKYKKPNEQEALVNANVILDTLNPNETMDVEIIGLSGAINKRLYELTHTQKYLDNAIRFYEKGFQIKQDYYNGINAAYMLYVKASLQKELGEDWEDNKIKADFIRNSVLTACLQIEQDKDFATRQDAVWVLYSMAEAYNYKGKQDKLNEYEAKAVKVANETNQAFAEAAYEEQKGKIAKIHF